MFDSNLFRDNSGGITPNSEIRGVGWIVYPVILEKVSNIELQKPCSFGHNQNMCSRVAGDALQRSHVGSKSLLILASLSFDQWRRWTTLNCIIKCLRHPEEAEIFFKTCDQVVSGILSPISPSHLCLRSSRLVRLFSLSIVYILPISCFAPTLYLNIRSKREEEGCKGIHLDSYETKSLICKYLKNFWESSSKDQIYYQCINHLKSIFQTPPSCQMLCP